MTTHEQLPVAVYGTLRTGMTNYGLLAGRTTHIEPATVRGYKMGASRWIPYVMPAADGQSIVVELMWLLPNVYDMILAELDDLEGYLPGSPESSHYLRTAVPVTLSDGEQTQAWLYEAGPNQKQTFNQLRSVTSGDYKSAVGALL